MAESQTAELFRRLSGDDLDELRQIAQERLFAAGDRIFHEGDSGDGVYVIKSGAVEIAHVVGGESRRVFSRLGAGEIFGEMAVIEDLPRSATAIAAEATRLYFLPRDAMLTLLQRSPPLAFRVLQEISRRLREFNARHLREIIEAERLAVVGNFARAIIHDLKNPLTIIALSAEKFDQPDLRPEIRGQTQARIRKQVARINDLVGDILIFTEGKRREAETKPADYRAFILDLAADLRAELEIKNIRLELQNEPPAILVPLDAHRLTRVFYNLVHNAADFMPDGGAIFLRFQTGEREIVTEIEDTGSGIAPEIADKLFQPFATHGKAHGTGLGLSICKKIIEDHGGKIRARSEPGRGAVFCFSLPLTK